MDVGTLAGIAVGLFAVIGLGMSWQIAPFIDVPSLGVVGGGILATILIALPLDALKLMLPSFKFCFIYKSDSPKEIIKQICGFSDVARRDGILALENVLETIQDPFLRQGIQLAVDGTDPELITDIMESEMDNIDARHAAAKKPWETFKNGGPSWGALGTVMGLIVMLKGGIEDPAKLTSGMALALVTTFYGSMIASFVVGPFVDKLDVRHKEEMGIKAIMLKGVMALQSGDNPRIVEQKLKIFLPPRERNFGRGAT
jgi:chemotaxis protein MotA